MRPPFTAAIAISAKEQALRDSQEYYGQLMFDLDDEADDAPVWWETRARRDALPEGTTYIDTGCDLSPSCLECPFARCRYDPDYRPADVPGSVRSPHKYAMFMALREQGWSVDAAAREVGVSRRQGFRYLHYMRGEPA